MKKKIILLLTATTMVISLLAGCGAETTGTERAEAVVEAVTEIQEEAATADAGAASVASDETCPYPLYTMFYDNRGIPYFYGKWGGSANMDADNLAMTNNCMAAIDSHMMASGASSWMVSWKLIGTYSGMKVVVRYVEDGNSPEAVGIPTAGNGIWQRILGEGLCCPSFFGKIMAS